jgi:hypothetical protein
MVPPTNNTGAIWAFLKKILAHWVPMPNFAAQLILIVNGVPEYKG